MAASPKHTPIKSEDFHTTSMADTISTAPALVDKQPKPLSRTAFLGAVLILVSLNLGLMTYVWIVVEQIYYDFNPKWMVILVHAAMCVACWIGTFMILDLLAMGMKRRSAGDAEKQEA